MKRQKPSGVHFSEIAREENKGYSNFPSAHDSFFESSGIPENHQN
jgi:hypothetical protein